MVACKFAKENYCGSRYFYEDLGRVARKGDKVSIAKSGDVETSTGEKSLWIFNKHPEVAPYRTFPRPRALLNLLIILAQLLRTIDRLETFCQAEGGNETTR